MRYTIDFNDILGLLTLIHEGRDAATYPVGSKEREIIKRFSILLPNSASKRRDSVASRLSARSSQKSSVEDRLSMGALPSPSLTNFESPSDLQWLPALWDSLQEFAVDVTGPAILQSPAGSAYGDVMNVSFDADGLSQSRLVGFSPSSDHFDS